MGSVVSVRFREEEQRDLERIAHTMQRSVGETAAILLREKIREELFPFIDFRVSAGHRDPAIKGTRLKVWQVVMVARQLAGGAEAVAEDLGQPVSLIQAALDYAEAYSEEIEAELRYVESITFEDLRRILPGITRSTID